MGSIDEIEHDVDDYEYDDYVRSSFQNFASLPLSITLNPNYEKGALLLPPSPNWYFSGAIDCRESDRLYAAACFKSIILYRIGHGEAMPIILKNIGHGMYGKVCLVKLFPNVGDEERHSLLLASSEYGQVTLFDCELGHVKGQHSDHNNAVVGGLAWVLLEDDSTQAVSVDSDGLITIWNVETNITKTHKILPDQNAPGKNKVTAPVLTVIEPVPHEKGKVLIAAEKDIYYIDLKCGSVLSRLRGHHHNIYAIKWCPFKDPFVAETDWKGSDPRKPGRSNTSNNWRGSSSDNWRDEQKSGVTTPSQCVTIQSTGTNTKELSNYFATSDLGVHIYLWDFTTERYVRTAVIDTKKKIIKNRQNNGTPSPIAWHNNKLICGSFEGDVRRLTFLRESETVTVEKSFEKVTLNEGEMVKEEETEKSGIVSKESNAGKYRSCFNNVYNEHSRVVYTIGVIGSTVISTSQDRNLVGYCLDKSKLLFSIPTIGCSINSIAFNPHASNWFALGLQEGCIKLIDLQGFPPIKSKNISMGIKGKVLSLAWHPLKENIILYGTGDGQVGVADVNNKKVNTFSLFHQKPVYNLCWGPSLPLKSDGGDYIIYTFSHKDLFMRDPVDYMKQPDKLSDIVPNLPNDLSEFCFSHDFQYLAVGCLSGEVCIICTKSLEVLLKLMFVRKTIQHILWKPQDLNGKDTIYSIAIASNDSKVCLLDLNQLLATRSTEKTEEVNIISTCTRELIGHAGRVVYMCFSSHNTDFLVTASYDNTCQVWHTGTGKRLGNYRGHLSRCMRVLFSPDQPGLLYSFSEDSNLHQWRLNGLEHKNPPNKVNKPVDPKIVPVKSKPVDSEVQSVQVRHSEKKKSLHHRSLFPLLHKASSHKRSFYLLIALSLFRHKMEALKCEAEDEEETLEQLTTANNEESDCPSPRPPLTHFDEVCASLPSLLEEETIPREHAQVFLDFYGPPLQIREFLKQQVSDHQAGSHIAPLTTLHTWQGTTEQAVKLAIAEKKLTADIVALTPQISISLWMSASEAYAYQLGDAGEPLMAANYLLNANKVEEAVEMLIKHKQYREALTLAKVRLPFSSELQERVCQIFSAVSMSDGFYDMAALIKGSLGEAQEACSSLCRRGDSSSLLTAAVMYKEVGHANAHATFLECLRLSGAKLELTKMENVVALAPEFEWFRPVMITLEYLVIVPSMVISPSEGQDTPPPPHTRDYTITTKEGQTVAITEEVQSRMQSAGLCTQEVYTNLVSQLATSVQPTQPKQFWYLVSVEVSKLLLSLVLQSSDSVRHLESVVLMLATWGRSESVYALTHALAPHGVDSLPPLLKSLFTGPEASLFRHLYILSEVHSRASHLLTLTSPDEEETLAFVKHAMTDFMPEFASASNYALPDGCGLSDIDLYRQPKEGYRNLLQNLLEKSVITDYTLSQLTLE